MKKYVEHIKSQEPHARRTHAMQVATGVTVAVFLVWITTLGVRLGGTGELVADSGSGNQTQNVDTNKTSLSAAAQATQDTNKPRLEVSTTSVFTPSLLPTVHN